MSNNKMIEAIELIEAFHGKSVVSIMQEDGSGNKYCYTLRGDKMYQFIDIKAFKENMSNIAEIAKRHGLI